MRNTYIGILFEMKDSEHRIDQKHLAYWDECIDKTYRPVDLKTEVIMIPEKIKARYEIIWGDL